MTLAVAAPASTMTQGRRLGPPLPEAQDPDATDGRREEEREGCERKVDVRAKNLSSSLTLRYPFRAS